MSKQPPIPPDQRDRIAAGHPETLTEDGDAAGSGKAQGRNVKSQGRQGNVYQNTHNQGRQQDR